MKKGLRKSGYLTRREAKFGYFFISPWLIGFACFAIGPIIASFYLSLTNYDLFTPSKWIGLGNYKGLFEDPLFLTSIYNTVYYVIFAVPLGIVFSLSLALLLNQKLHGIATYRTIFYLPAVTSGVAVALLWMWLFNADFGLINFFLVKLGLSGVAWLVDPEWAKPAFILMSLWGAGGGMIIFLGSLQGVPVQLYEAAEIDGANWLHKFWHITFPMISPAIFFNLIMGIIGSFQIFTQAYIMTGGGPANATLFYVLYVFRNAFMLLKMGYASAMAWILFVLVLILTLIQFKLAGKWVYYEAKK